MPDQPLGDRLPPDRRDPDPAVPDPAVRESAVPDPAVPDPTVRDSAVRDSAVRGLGERGPRRPGSGRRRWLVVGGVLLVAAVVTGWLVRAPTPGAAGPLAGTGSAGEAAPHVHVTGDGMAGMTGAAVPGPGTRAAARGGPPGAARLGPVTGGGWAGRTGGGVPARGPGAAAGGSGLEPLSTGLAPGAPSQLRFRILGPDGPPVPRFAIARDRPLPLIVARHDLG